MIRASRKSQPYRKGVREQGSALQAMLQGTPTYLPNPGRTQQDMLRKARLRQLRRLLSR